MILIFKKFSENQITMIYWLGKISHTYHTYKILIETINKNDGLKIFLIKSAYISFGARNLIWFIEFYFHGILKYNDIFAHYFMHIILFFTF